MAIKKGLIMLKLILNWLFSSEDAEHELVEALEARVKFKAIEQLTSTSWND